MERRPSNVVFGTDYSMCNVKKHLVLESLEVEKEVKEKIFYKKSIKLFKLRPK